MKSSLGLLGFVLVLCGMGLFAWAWSARQGEAARTDPAVPTGAQPAAPGGAPEVELRTPPEELPESPPQPAVPAEPEVPAAAAEPVVRPLLEQTEADWLLEFAEAPREVLERESESLAERIAEESKVAFKLALAEGGFEVVPAGTPAPSDPDDPNGLFVSDNETGDGNVQRVVLYPTDAPQLYALRSKMQWLEHRLAVLGDG